MQPRISPQRLHSLPRLHAAASTNSPAWLTFRSALATVLGGMVSLFGVSRDVNSWAGCSNTPRNFPSSSHRAVDIQSHSRKLMSHPGPRTSLPTAARSLHDHVLPANIGHGGISRAERELAAIQFSSRQRRSYACSTSMVNNGDDDDATSKTISNETLAMHCSSMNLSSLPLPFVYATTLEFM